MPDADGCQRIASAFSGAANQGRAALLGYVVAGDPEPTTSALVVEALAGSSLDVLELGVPYSDPLADGPTIQAAAQRALGAGASMELALELASLSRGRLAVLLFTYYNPVYQFGVERFAFGCRQAGVAGAIVPDLPLEEATAMAEALRAEGLAMPLLVAPTTAAGRQRRIAARSTGFVYMVSRLGVTGEGEGPALGRLRARLSRIRSATDLPLAVGFGIGRREQAHQVAQLADGVVVGSALVASYAGLEGSPAAGAAVELVEELAPGLLRQAGERLPKGRESALSREGRR